MLRSRSRTRAATPAPTSAGMLLRYSRGIYAGVSPSALFDPRASPAFGLDGSAGWVSFDAGVPRITDRGLLVENGRLNLVSNNTMNGAFPGAPGLLPTGWTMSLPGGTQRTIVGLPQASGVECMDLRVRGTVTGSALTIRPCGNTPVAAAGLAGKHLCFSTFVQVLDNVGDAFDDLRLSLSVFDAAMNPLAYVETGNIAFDTVLGRSWANALNLPSGAAYILPEIGSTTDMTGRAVDVTLRLGWPGLEVWDATETDSPVPSSPIRAETGPTMRDSESVRAPVSQLPIVDAVTIYLVARMPQARVRGATFLELHRDTQLRAGLRLSASADATQLVLQNYAFDDAMPGKAVAQAPGPGALFGAAIRMAGSEMTLCVDGAAYDAATSGAVLQPGMEWLYQGCTSGGVNHCESEILLCQVIPHADDDPTLIRNANPAMWGETE